MKILLISPPLSFQLKRKIFPRFPPYFLLSVAAQLEKAGFQVCAYDAYLETADLGQVIREVERVSPALVGLCAADLTRFSPLATDIQVIEELKSAFPGLPIAVFGLSNPALAQELATRLPGLDYLISGDPEEAMVKAAKQLESGRKGTEFAPGTVFDAGIIADLDRIDPPAWRLVDLSRYQSFPHRYKAARAYPVVGSRGCPWNKCTFCKSVSPASSPVYRSRSPEHLVAEIEKAVQEQGYTEVQFYEGNFNTEIGWLRTFHGLIKDKKLKFSWSCLCRVDNINGEILKLMKDAGCWNITFGIESSSQTLLDSINKGINPESAGKAVRMAASSGIETTGSFLIGLPGEEPGDVEDSARFAVRIGLDYAQFFIAKWYGDHPQFSGSGTLLENWDYTQFDFRGRPFLPAAYKDLDALKDVQRRAYRIFYFHPRTMVKHLSRLRSFSGCVRLFRGLKTMLMLNKEKT